MTSRDAISVELGKLKRELEDYNYHHRDSKINYTQVCRTALHEELNNRRLV
jgi:hypothetical protein